jgi:hypothetical protein
LIAMSVLVRSQPLPVLLDTKTLLGAVGTVRSPHAFSGWAARAVALVACFDFREQRALA